jgi:hypothetical protein
MGIAGTGGASDRSPDAEWIVANSDCIHVGIHAELGRAAAMKNGRNMENNWYAHGPHGCRKG